MKYLVIGLLSLTVACGNSKDTRPYGSSETPPAVGIAEAPSPAIAQDDPETYAAKFETLGKKLLWPDFKITTTITFDTNKPMPKVGEPEAWCLVGTHTVVIVKAYWDQANGSDRQVTVYHELGHCELNRPHLKTALPDGKPMSTMNPSGVYWAAYQEHQDYYDRELFSVVNAEYPAEASLLDTDGAAIP